VKGRPRFTLIETLEKALEEVERRVGYLLRRGDSEKRCMHEATPFRSGRDLA